jgi:hypothetical protein
MLTMSYIAPEAARQTGRKAPFSYCVHDLNNLKLIAEFVADFWMNV